MLVKVSAAVTAPAVCGLNVTVNAALFPAGIVTGSDSPPTVNAELLLLTALTMTLAPPAVRVPDAVPLGPRPRYPGEGGRADAERASGRSRSNPREWKRYGRIRSRRVIVMVPVRVPVAVGVNFALYVQLDPGASVL